MSKTASVTVDCPGCCDDPNKCTTLECRRRGGTVELCGEREYGEPSIPPRFYLQEQIGGSVVICNHLSPPGPQCAVDACDNPVGLVWEVARTYICTGGVVKMVYARLTVTGVADVGSGQVSISFSAYSTASSTTSAAHSWLIYINGVIAGGSYSGPGSTTFSRQAANGATLDVSLVIDNNSADCGQFPASSGSPNLSCLGSSCAVRRDVTWCVPRGESTRHVYAGARTYDPAISCDDPATDTRTREPIDEDTGCNPPTSGGTPTATPSAFDPEFAALVELDTAVSGPTLKQQRSNGACVGDLTASHCDRYSELNQEDTDEDARLRLLSGPGGEWGDWITVGDGTGGTCINPPCCMSQWGIRIDRTYDYFEAEFRGKQGGLNPGDKVDMVIKVYRRAAGSTGPFIHFADIEYDDVEAVGPEEPPFSAVAEVTGAVPIDEGFETFVRCAVVPPSEEEE